MNKSPLLNALLAFLYIAGLVFFIFNFLEPLEDTDTVLMPMVVLSLLVLSAATMGYLFLAQPAMLYLDGKKQEGLQFFLKTLGSFAAIVGALLVVIFVFLSTV